MLSSAYIALRPGQLTPTDQQGIPFHIVSCSGYKAGEEEEGCLDEWHLSPQVTIMPDGALLAWEWLKTCLPMGQGE